jgi:hypothetical protein
MAKKGHLVGGGGYISAGAQQFALAVIDLDAATPEAELIAIPFLAHGIAIDPTDPARAVLFEKKGPGACLVDLRRRTLVSVLSTPPSRRFYGHGAFSADGALLYATESLVDRDFAGVLVVRDARTFAELGVVPTYGEAPHDCQLLEDGKTMVVTNGGGSIEGKSPAQVCYLDLESERLLESVALESPRFNTGHLAVTPSGDLAVVSAPRDGLPSPNQQLGAVSLRPRGGKLTTMQAPAAIVQRMLGETLSVVIHEPDRVVLATHPLGNCVSMWRLPDGEFLGQLELAGPRGVTVSLDGAWYLVSHLAGRSVRVTAFCTKTREPVGFFVDPSFTSGSHVMVHAL